MLYEEDLELHFWNGESYDKTKVIQFLNFVLKNQKEIIFFTITYIEFNVNQTQVTEQAYEGESLDKVFQINDYENSSDLKNILENMLVERIVFECGDDTKKVFYTVISENSFYYSYNFKVEDGSIYEIFSNILPLYKELISIFQPKISNGGFEVVREDADRIQKESFFEGIYGYLSNDYDFNRFIDFEEKILFGDGFIFVIKTEKNNGLLGKIMNNLKKNMEMRIDNIADAVYLYLINDSTASNTELFDLGDLGMLNFDINQDGFVLGIEILPISIIFSLDNVGFYYEDDFLNINFGDSIGYDKKIVQNGRTVELKNGKIAGINLKVQQKGNRKKGFIQVNELNKSINN